MISSKLLQELSEVTEEEKKLLRGADTIDHSIYMEKHCGTVSSRKLLCAGKLITVRPHTRFVHFPKHSHDYIEVVYVCRGELTHIIDGEKVKLKAGELLFLGKNASHEILPASKDDVAVNFIVLPEFFDSPLAMLSEETSPLKSFLVDNLKNGGESPCYMHFEISGVLTVQNLIENLIITLTTDAPLKRKISSYTMGLLFLQLMNSTEHLSYKSEHERAIIETFRYIDENYRDGSLSELCESLHYDFYHLSREIKRRTGKTYTEIVQERRLSQAAYLLKNTDFAVSDIATQVGYDNTSYFYRLFKAHFGVLPKEYRQ